MGTYSEMDIMHSRDESAFYDGDDESAFEESMSDELNTPSAFSAASSSAGTQKPSTEDGAVSQTAPASSMAETEETQDEDAKRRAHEEAEAKRKAEWEAMQQEKKAARQAELERLAAMNDDEVMSNSMKRVGTETERLTRRNMKECISEYIQTICLSDAAFARMVMHPRKSMIHCVWYINRKAREFVEQEMKDNDIKPERNGIYGSDVPDELCYQWAEEYFRDPNAKEDKEEEEKFVPRPYAGKNSSKSSAKGKKGKSEAKKPEEKKTEPAKKPDAGQMTLGDFGMLGASA